MRIDDGSFADLIRRLDRASDAVLRATQGLVALADDDPEFVHALDQLMAVATEMSVMERILRATVVANRQEASVREAPPPS